MMKNIVLLQKISIIIPCLNEQDNLIKCLKPLQAIRQQGHQIILVDGGSKDASTTLAAPYVDLVLESSPGRAKQMNLGAKHAQGQLLWFLHADSDNTLFCFNALPIDTPIWGRFDVAFSCQDWPFKMIAFFINLRSRITSINTGDQGLFISTDLFKKIGGFPDLALMEDVAISKILKRQMRPQNLKVKLISSSRRWQQHGIIKTILFMWSLRLRYFLGASSQSIAKAYYPNKPDSN